jgi:hypothetical protein
VINSSSTTQEYQERLGNATLLAHIFSFHHEATSGEFGGSTFAIGAGTVKWSINITTSSDNSLGSDDITLRYSLSDLSLSFAANSSSQSVSRRSGSPIANMTTYVLFLSDGLAAAEVEVFDVALVDGVLRPITHSILVSPSSSSSSYVLELTFPGGFNESLYYDPSLGLGGIRIAVLVVVGDIAAGIRRMVEKEATQGQQR